MHEKHPYEFHKREVLSIRTATEHTLEVCKRIELLIESISDDKAALATWPVHDFLDPGSRQAHLLDGVEHLLDPAARPVVIPSGVAMDGDSTLSLPQTQQVRLAHRAAWYLNERIHNWLFGVWCQRNLGLNRALDPESASDEIIQFHWDELRDYGAALLDLDCNELRGAIESESIAAIDLSRQRLAGLKAETPRLNIVDLEKWIPQLGASREADWVRAVSAEMQNKFGYTSTYLRTARSQGEKTPTETFGRDTQDRIWRRDPDDMKVIWYWRSSIKHKK